jgi:hypothetical protein
VFVGAVVPLAPDDAAQLPVRAQIERDADLGRDLRLEVGIF